MSAGEVSLLTLQKAARRRKESHSQRSSSQQVQFLSSGGGVLEQRLGVGIRERKERRKRRAHSRKGCRLQGGQASPCVDGRFRAHAAEHPQVRRLREVAIGAGEDLGEWIPANITQKRASVKTKDEERSASSGRLGCDRTTCKPVVRVQWMNQGGKAHHRQLRPA